MKFSLDYCEHRVSHAGLGASGSLIIPNGRIMDKIVYVRFASENEAAGAADAAA
jgi:hypothetical protein